MLTCICGVNESIYSYYSDAFGHIINLRKTGKVP